MRQCCAARKKECVEGEEYEGDVSVWESTLIAQTISLSLSLIFFLLDVYRGLYLHMHLEKRDCFVCAFKCVRVCTRR